MEGGEEDEEKKGYLSLPVTAVIAQINIHADTHTQKKIKEQRAKSYVD